MVRHHDHLVQASILLIAGLVEMLPFILFPNFSASAESTPGCFLKNVVQPKATYWEKKKAPGQEDIFGNSACCMGYVASLVAIQWKARHLVPPTDLKCISIQMSSKALEVFGFLWNHLGLHIREEASLNFPRISLTFVLSWASFTTIWAKDFIE